MFAVQINGQLMLGLGERRFQELVTMCEEFVKKVQRETEHDLLEKKHGG